MPHPPPTPHHSPPTTHHPPPNTQRRLTAHHQPPTTYSHHHTAPHPPLTHKLSTLTELADGLTGEPLCFELIETARELLGELNKKVFL